MTPFKVAVIRDRETASEGIELKRLNRFFDGIFGIDVRRSLARSSLRAPSYSLSSPAARDSQRSGDPPCVFRRDASSWKRDTRFVRRRRRTRRVVRPRRLVPFSLSCFFFFSLFIFVSP